MPKKRSCPKGERRSEAPYTFASGNEFVREGLESLERLEISVLLSSDLRRTGDLECSDDGMRALTHSLAVVNL